MLPAVERFTTYLDAQMGVATRAAHLLALVPPAREFGSAFRLTLRHWLARRWDALAAVAADGRTWHLHDLLRGAAALALYDFIAADRRWWRAGRGAGGTSLDESTGCLDGVVARQ